MPCPKASLHCICDGLPFNTGFTVLYHVWLMPSFSFHVYSLEVQHITCLEHRAEGRKGRPKVTEACFIQSIIKGWTSIRRCPAFSGNLILAIPGRALSYFKHFSSTHRAHSLCCWLAILHSYAFRILHFPLGTTLHALCLHLADLLSTHSCPTGDPTKYDQPLLSSNTIPPASTAM